MILHHSMSHIKVARNLRNRQAVMLKKKLEDLNGIIGQLALWLHAIKLLLFKVFTFFRSFAFSVCRTDFSCSSVVICSASKETFFFKMEK